MPSLRKPAAELLPLSQQLSRIAEEGGDERLTFTDLAARLESRAWGGLLLIFGAVNVLPLPPGTSTFFAIPLLIVSAQMVAGRISPWFPRRIDKRGISKQLLAQIVSKMSWIERRVERIFRPRLPALTGPAGARVIGAACFVLALVAAIPIPLFHIAPAAAIVMFALALIYRDGGLAIFAAIAGILSILLDVVVIGSGIALLGYAASRLGL